MEIYAEIKTFELQKQDLMKEHQNSNVLSNGEAILNQIEELQKKLDGANRVESKRIQQQINELQNEKNKVLRELQKVEEQIERRQAKIERLNEQANKTSIKNQVLGKDADRNEYWFFKEEPSKLFVKKFHGIPAIISMTVPKPEQQTIQENNEVSNGGAKIDIVAENIEMIDTESKK